MKTLARTIALSLLLIPVAVEAQMSNPSPLPPTPTNRILAIGRFNAAPTPGQFKLLSSQEVPDTLRLYLAGKIDQWYSIQNDNGVVFILNATTVEEAHIMLEALPLGQAKLMTFQLIPLGPISPLALLLPKPDKPAQ
jgi:hypothetical protein